MPNVRFSHFFRSNYFIADACKLYDTKEVLKIWYFVTPETVRYDLKQQSTQVCCSIKFRREACIATLVFEFSINSLAGIPYRNFSYRIGTANKFGGISVV